MVRPFRPLARIWDTMSSGARRSVAASVFWPGFSVIVYRGASLGLNCVMSSPIAATALSIFDISVLSKISWSVIRLGAAAGLGADAGGADHLPRQADRQRGGVPGRRDQR